MPQTQTASEQITDEVLSWPGAPAATARAASSPSRSAAARSGTCTATASCTSASRRPSGMSSSTRAGSTTTRSSPASRATPRARSQDADDVSDVIALLRMNYDRAVATHGLPEPD